MAANPYMKFFVGDWIRDTRRCSEDEKGVWIELIVFMHVNEECGFIEGTWEDIAQLVQTKNVVKFKQIVRQLLSKKVCDFKLISENSDEHLEVVRIVNRRMFKAFNISKVRSKVGSEGGKKSGESRKLNKSKSETKVNQNPGSDYGNGNGLYSGEGMEGGNITPYISGIGLLPRMLSVYKLHYPSYPEDESNDYPALLEIAHKIAKYLKIPKDKVLTDHADLIEIRWGDLASFAEQDEDWFSTKSIPFINKHFQDFLQKFLKYTPVKNESRSSEIQESVREKFDRISRESVTGPIR